MAVSLTHSSYGKSRIRFIKVTRENELHTARELTVSVKLEGDFSASYIEGDNRRVVPTDTIKNIVFALARQHPLDSPESFALALGSRFHELYEHVTNVQVEVDDLPWNRIVVRGQAHPNSFWQATKEIATALADSSRDATSITGGFRDLALLKTSDSSFEGFHRDDWTTLPEQAERLLATSLTARWDYQSVNADFLACRQQVREALVATFAEHQSLSAQHTLQLIAAAALKACPEIQRVHITLPNRHCLLTDPAPQGAEGSVQIYVPTDEPHGLMEGTVERE